MVVEKGFKQTEFGVIPIEWSVRSTIQIAQNAKYSIKIGPFGSALKKELLVPNGYKVYGQENVFEENIETGDRFINIEHFKKLKTCELFPGDFVVSMMGTVGHCMIMPENMQAGIMDSHLLRIRIENSTTNSSYFRHIFSSYLTINQIRKLSVGGIMEGLSSKIIKQILFISPPVPEQTAISIALSDIDEIISQTEKLIDKKKAIKQGVMQELLKPKEGWVTKKFTDIVDYIHGKAHEQFIVDDGKFKVVNSKFISSNGEVVKYSNNSFLTAKKNDILTVLSDLPNGKALAKCFLVDKDNLYAVNQRVCIWRSKGADSIFLFYLLNRHKYFLQLDDGVTQTHILNGDINRFELTITEDLETQKEIGVILSDLDKEIAILEKRNNKLNYQKQGMMQALLTGKIRLI